jgi:hypothetical protein
MDEIIRELRKRLEILIDEQVDGTELLDLCTDINAVSTILIHSGQGIINEGELLQQILLEADPFKAVKISEWFNYATENLLPLWPALKIGILIKGEWPTELRELIEKLEPDLLKKYEND